MHSGAMQLEFRTQLSVTLGGIWKIGVSTGVIVIANIPKTCECKNLEFSWEIKKELRVWWQGVVEETMGRGLQGRG